MELLVVMAIIAILAGMAVGGAQMARKRGSITKARSAIAALEAAIDMYDMDIGVYPPSGGVNLVRELTDSTDPDWEGPYMRFKNEDLEGGSYLDSWGNPYVYINPGVNNPKFYDIYSFGPDGVDEQGKGDDITNW